jgi:hypothetical protein
METILNKYITVTHHDTDGFTLSYLTDSGHYYHHRYIDYRIYEAKRRFKLYVYAEEYKIFRTTLDKALWRNIC